MVLFLAAALLKAIILLMTILTSGSTSMPLEQVTYVRSLDLAALSGLMTLRMAVPIFSRTFVLGSAISHPYSPFGRISMVQDD